MSSITVRRLSEEVHNALKAEAASEGISAEEKIRRILTQHVRPEMQSGLGDELTALVDEFGLTGDGEAFRRIEGDVDPAPFG